MRLTMILAFTMLAAAAGQTADFSGTWETTYGTLFLQQDNSDVTGYYDMGGYCSVEGTVNSSGRLVFIYVEPNAAGEGWFELTDDAMAFTGEWRPDGGGEWFGWEGFRAGAGMAPSNWLVVLEAEWQESMTEGEYSFGEMLDAWFARVPGVSVRHRFVHDAQDVASFCLECSALPGNLYLVIASHGSSSGVSLPGGTLTPEQLIQALVPCTNISMLHFSCCEVMAGATPSRVLASRQSWPEGFVVSGYSNSVDWAASGILEIFYFNQILEMGLPPSEAAQSVMDEIGFAGDQPTEWMDAAGFEWLEPGATPSVSGRPPVSGRTRQGR